MNFVPQYDDSVRESLEDGSDAANVSPNYCLTVPSARVLMGILSDLKPVLRMDKPWPSFGPWVFNHFVPWLDFTLADGSVASRNAATLASYWTMAENGNYDISKAEAYARGDIAGTF